MPPSFCSNCGKPIADAQAKFCSNCGHPLTSAQPVQPIQYEYHDFELHWDRFVTTYGKLVSDAQAPIYFWSQVQDKVLVRLGEWLEQGWEPVTPVGPSCLVIKYGQKFNWKWMLTENTAQLMDCRIKLRRIKS